MAKAKFILNTLERIVVVLMFLGVGFKILNWPGASMLVLLGGILFLIVSFTKLIRTKTNNNWTLKYKWGNVFTILSGLALATGIIFKQQHYPFATLLINSGGILLLLAIILTNWKLSMSKKQMVVAAIFCVWVLLALIFNIKQTTYKNRVENHLNEMIEVNTMMLNSLNEEQKINAHNHFMKIDLIVTGALNNYGFGEIVTEKFKESNFLWLSSSNWRDVIFGENGIVDSLHQKSLLFADVIMLRKGLIKSEITFTLLKKEYWLDESKVHFNIYFPWKLLDNKRSVLELLTKGNEVQQHPFYISNEKNDKRLAKEIDDFIVNQSQFGDSIIWAVLFFFFTLYANVFRVPVKVQRPLIFVGVFVVLEFVLLTIDPILQTEFNNGYLVALVEVGLAALVIPFHSMVEHNLYSNLESNNDE